MDQYCTYVKNHKDSENLKLKFCLDSGLSVSTFLFTATIVSLIVSLCLLKAYFARTGLGFSTSQMGVHAMIYFLVYISQIMTSLVLYKQSVYIIDGDYTESQQFFNLWGKHFVYNLTLLLANTINRGLIFYVLHKYSDFIIFRQQVFEK